VPALAHFISFHTYGTWLHGREDGSVDRLHNVVGKPALRSDPDRVSLERSKLKHPPITLCAERRFVVHETIQDVCDYRRWALKALNVRTTYVHVVLAGASTPERAMNDLKAYCTRRMREAHVLAADLSPWSYHGSTRYLDSDNSLCRAITYVRDEQGPPLEMKCPASWAPRRSSFPDDSEPQ
jgi:hypothetical protein